MRSFIVWTLADMVVCCWACQSIILASWLKLFSTSLSISSTSVLRVWSWVAILSFMVSWSFWLSVALVSRMVTLYLVGGYVGADCEPVCVGFFGEVVPLEKYFILALAFHEEHAGMVFI